jgi:hypothetical protein
MDENIDRRHSEDQQTLRDDEIVTEPRVARRSFLRRTGAVLGGAAAVLAGVRAATAKNSGRDDPKPAPPPDPPPPPPPDRERREDPDKPRREDPDKPRPEDREKKRPADPDKPPDQAKR